MKYYTKGKMVLNSIEFAIFFIFVFTFYWSATRDKLKVQNILLLVSSYFFYAIWDYRFLLLLLFSTLVNFIAGKKISESQGTGKRRFWFYTGIVLNLGVLGMFKYSSFWFNSVSEMFSTLHLGNAGSSMTNTVLPVGISYYTFCGLSYIIDVYRKRINRSRDYVEYSLFVSFFPTLIAGPIERAYHLLPQLQQVRGFNYEKAADGLKQILWGLFKKIVIADGCALYVNMIFGDTTNYSGSTLLLGAMLFSFQIYADFSGYSDIALGSARLLGIELLQNFSFPYFSRDIAEFWRRWHISLSSWFRDYVFYPLERRRIPVLGRGINTIIVFLLTGLWHGANWTFIAWGGLQAIYFLVFFLFNKNKSPLRIAAQGKYFPSMNESVNIGLTFGLVTFSWIFFRADNLGQSMIYISRLFSRSMWTIPEIIPIKILLLVLIFIIIEWLGREQKYAIERLATNWPRPLRWFFYYIIIFVVFYFSGSQQQFIYAQF